MFVKSCLSSMSFCVGYWSAPGQDTGVDGCTTNRLCIASKPPSQWAPLMMGCQVREAAARTSYLHFLPRMWICSTVGSCPEPDAELSCVPKWRFISKTWSGLLYFSPATHASITGPDCFVKCCKLLVRAVPLYLQHAHTKITTQFPYQLTWFLFSKLQPPGCNWERLGPILDTTQMPGSMQQSSSPVILVFFSGSELPLLHYSASVSHTRENGIKVNFSTAPAGAVACTKEPHCYVFLF